MAKYRLYLSKVEPVLVPTTITVPDFGWFYQQVDIIRKVVRRLPVSIQTGFFAFVELVIPPLRAAETILIIPGTLTQIQSRAEPVVIEAVPVPPLVEADQRSVILETVVIIIPDRMVGY